MLAGSGTEEVHVLPCTGCVGAVLVVLVLYLLCWCRTGCVSIKWCY